MNQGKLLKTRTKLLQKHNSGRNCAFPTHGNGKNYEFPSQSTAVEKRTNLMKCAMRFFVKMAAEVATIP